MNDLSAFIDKLDSRDPHWTDSSRYDLMVHVRDDYRKLTEADATARAVVASFEQYVPYARDFRMDHGIPLDARLDSTETMDAQLSTPVTDLQAALRSAAEYMDGGRVYEDSAALARNLRDCGGYGSKYCKDACDMAGRTVFGSSFDDFLEACQDAVEDAARNAASREKAKSGRLGFKDYGIRTLEAYGQFTKAQEGAFRESAERALYGAEQVRDSRLAKRDELYREAQAVDREAQEFGPSFSDPYAEYMAYERSTDYDAAIDAFFGDYAEVYAFVDSDSARDQLDGIMSKSLDTTAKYGHTWQKAKQAALAEKASMSAELAEAFAKQDAEPHYDAWEQEHLDDLF